MADFGLHADDATSAMAAARLMRYRAPVDTAKRY